MNREREREREREIATLNYEISTMWGKKPRTTLQKTTQMLLAPEEVTRSKPCKIYHDNSHPPLLSPHPPPNIVPFMTERGKIL